MSFNIHQDSQEVELNCRGRPRLRIDHRGELRRGLSSPSPEGRSRSPPRTPLRLTMKEIAVRTPYTYQQVQHASETPVTPQKSKPRPYSRRLSPYQLDQLQEFLDDEPANRDVPWQDLRYLLPCLYEPGLDAVKTAMQDLGYYKTTKKKSPLNTPAVRQKRVEMCQYLLERYPEPDDWLRCPIAFSDETFVMTFDRGLRLVTIHELEDPKTFTRLLHKGNGRMFWSFICGPYKGS
ncbi:hypothetical protein H9Q73_014254, partial [Fusarium xylarioides]